MPIPFVSLDTPYERFLRRLQRNHPAKWDTSDLAVKFIHFYNSGERIKVRTRSGDIEFGTVGVTTGWKPIWLLIHRSNHDGSSTTLTNEDTILAYQPDGPGTQYVDAER